MIGQDSIISQQTTIKVNGGHVWSEIIFTESNKNKVPVLVLHGGPGGDHFLMHWGLKSLASQFPVIFYDQIGGGFSSNLIEQHVEPLTLWTIQNFVNQLKSVVQFYKLKQFILLGSSWGSTLAIQYFFSNPEIKPKAMILNSPLISTKLWIQDANILKQQMPAQIYEEMIKCEKNKTTSSSLYYKAMSHYYKKHVCQIDILSQEQLTLYHSTSQYFNFHAYCYMWGPSEFYCSGTLSKYDRIQDIAKIDVPVLFSCGELDEARPETVIKFHHLAPNSEFFVFKNCSHCSYFEDSPKFQQILSAFYYNIVQK